MRPQVQDRMHAQLAPEPEVEGDVGVPRRAFRVVVGALVLRGCGAVRLDRDDETTSVLAGSVTSVAGEDYILI